MAKAGRGSEQVMIRLPEGMRDQIKETAEMHGRSMNAEIVQRLEASFDVISHSEDSSEKFKMEIQNRDEIISKLENKIMLQQEAYSELKDLFQIHKYVVDSYKVIVDRTESHAHRLLMLMRKIAATILRKDSEPSESELLLLKEVSNVADEMESLNKDSQFRKKYADEVLKE